MTRTNAGALTLAAILAASTATGALAQATTDDDPAQTDQAQTDQAQTGGDTATEPAEPAEQPQEDQAAGAEEQPDATMTQDGGTTVEEPAAEAEAEVVEEPAIETETEADVVVEGEPAEDTVITTDPAAADEGAAVVEEGAEPAEGDVVVIDEGAEPAGDDAAVVEGDAAPVEGAEVAQPVEGQIFEQSADQVLGSTLLDATVASPEGETIGDVADMVVSSDGQITGVVIGVGGFLGIGEREVAVEFDQIEISEDEGGTITFVLNATREQLEAAPEFQTRADMEAEMPAEETGATGEPAEPAAD